MVIQLLKQWVVSLCLLFLFSLSFGQAGKAVYQKPFSGEIYLGQKPPGKTPQPFGRGILSGEAKPHGTLVFSKDLTEIYWSCVSKDWQKGAIYFLKLKKGKWSLPDIASFSEPEHRDLCPVISLDNKKMFFTSMRPLNGSTGYNLWHCQRTGSGWSSAKPFGNTINKGTSSGCCLDINKDLYFMAWEKANPKSCNLYRSVFKENAYGDPVKLGKAVNSDFIETSPYIAPDGSYLIFSSSGRQDGWGGFDLYISFRDSEGKWQQAVNMGKTINSTKNEWFPSVSPDSKYIFYVSGKSGNEDYYWVDAGVINELESRSR